MNETLGVCALVWSAEVCVWFAVCFCGGALRVFRLNRPGAAFRPGHSFPEGECEHARPQHFADQPRVTGKVNPELLLSPQCQEFILTTGLSPFGVSHTVELHRHVVSIAPM